MRHSNKLGHKSPRKGRNGYYNKL